MKRGALALCAISVACARVSAPSDARESDAAVDVADAATDLAGDAGNAADAGPRCDPPLRLRWIQAPGVPRGPVAVNESGEIAFVPYGSQSFTVGGQTFAAAPVAFALVRMNRDGRILWARPLRLGQHGSPEDPGLVPLVALDARGNTYIGSIVYDIDGELEGGYVASHERDALVVSYGPDGQFRWVRGFSAGNAGRINGLALRALGDRIAITVHATQSLGLVQPPPTVGARETVHAILELSVDGEIRWAREIIEHGSLNWGSDPHPHAGGLVVMSTFTPDFAVDGVHVAEDSTSVVVSFDLEGHARWARTYPMAWSVTVAPDGSVCAGGGGRPGFPQCPPDIDGGPITNCQFWLGCWNSTGALAWTRRYGLDAMAADSYLFTNAPVAIGDTLYGGFPLYAGREIDVEGVHYGPYSRETGISLRFTPRGAYCGGDVVRTEGGFVDYRASVAPDSYFVLYGVVLGPGIVWGHTIPGGTDPRFWIALFGR